MSEWLRAIPNPRGYGYIFDEAAGGRPDPPVREEAAAGPSQVGGSPGLSEVYFRRLARRMDTMHDIHQRFAHDLTQALGTAFQFTGVDVQWPVFGEGHHYPPPDTPPAEEGSDSD